MTAWLVRSVRRFPFWIGVAGVITALVLSATVLPYELAKVTLPDWRDARLDEVIEAADELDLDIELAQDVHAPTQLRDRFFVASQSIEPGTRVERNTAVILKVTVELPDVVATSASQAVEEIRALRIEVDLDSAEQPDYVLSHFTVVQQIPSAGTKVDPASTVQLRSEPASMLVPSVIEMTYDEAERTLSASGLIAAAVDAPVLVEGLVASAADIDRIMREELPMLNVVAQSIQAESKIEAGTEVQLTLALPFVDVPNIVGLTTSAAQSVLDAAGLSASSESLGGSSSWKIAAQTPSAGARVLPDSSVTFSLAEPMITYEVTGNGSRAAVTWIAPGTFNISQDTNARLPWSMSWPYRGSSRGNFNAQMLSGNSITCRIIIDGEVVQENTSTGAYAVVSCG